MECSLVKRMTCPGKGNATALITTLSSAPALWKGLTTCPFSYSSSDHDEKCMHDNLQNSEMALQKYSLNECVYFLWHTQRNKEATPPQTQSSPHVTYMHVLSPLVKIGPLVTCKLTTFTQVLYSTCISRLFYLTVFGCKYCFCSSYHYFQALNNYYFAHFKL